MNTEKPNNQSKNTVNMEGLKPFTREELAKYNGLDGMPSYVAVDGLVHDMGDSLLWKDGKHFGNIAGRELTLNYKSCHAGRPRIDEFPVIGYVVSSQAENTEP